MKSLSGCHTLMKILIVDDERLARDRLTGLVENIYADWQCLQAADGPSALAVAQTQQPDIVLLDIRMPGMDGLEAASHLARLPQPPAIIFTTAYQEHALAAFEASAVDYLLKPIRSQRLQQALARARVVNRGRLDSLREALSDSAARSQLSVNERGRLQLIPVAEIAYLRADSKYVCIGWGDKELLSDEPLKLLAEEFADRFVRIHRNALVAPAHVSVLQKLDRNYVVCFRDSKTRLVVSRRHLARARQVLKTV